MDKLIDMAAPPPLGNGVENIREVIMLNKMTFDISSDDWQVRLCSVMKIMNYKIDGCQVRIIFPLLGTG